MGDRLAVPVARLAFGAAERHPHDHAAGDSQARSRSVEPLHLPPSGSPPEDRRLYEPSRAGLTHVPSGADLSVAGILGAARVRDFATLRSRNRRRYDAPGHLSASTRAGALERGLRTTFEATCRRPLWG